MVVCSEDRSEQKDKVWFALHWGVPVAYAFCAICLLLSFWEDHRRLQLAQDISISIRCESPPDLARLEAMLGDHFRRVERVRPGSNGMARDCAIIWLSPRVWLHLWVELQPESDHIREVSLIFANSKKISLEAPEQDIPGLPPWYGWLLLVTVTVVPGLLWLQISKKSCLGSLSMILVALVALLPLLALIPLSVVALLKIL